MRLSTSAAIALGGLGVALALAGALRWQSAQHVTRAGFWFDEVTFELPHLRAAGFDDPIDAREQATIRALARAELVAAFARFRLDVSESRAAFYTVRVVQQFAASRRLPVGAAGQSLVLAPLGGYGSVNFLMLGSLAIAYAPPRADRKTVIEGIGRGIGRAAAHEFAHQLLPGVPIHASTDDRSYEYELAARSGQYYGDVHWELAEPYLERRLGRR